MGNAKEIGGPMIILERSGKASLIRNLKVSK